MDKIPSDISMLITQPVEDREERIRVLTDLICNIHDREHAKFVATMITESIMELTRHQDANKEPPIPGPIMAYADRYLSDSDYTQKQLFGLQEKILSVIESKSQDILNDVKLLTEISEKEINTCLTECYHKQLVQRERIDVIHDKVIFRYYVK